MGYDHGVFPMTPSETKGNKMPELDLFEKQGGPSAKTLLKKIGDSFTGEVQGPAVELQTKDFDTEEPAFWPAKGNEEPKPKLAHVINLTIDGETYSLWCPIPSDLDAKFLAAVKKSGNRNVAAGGKLTVKLVGEEKRKDGKKGFPKKLHEVTYSAPDLEEDVPFKV
jgi:hypothetical protein